jgi:hypothetical protein
MLPFFGVDLSALTNIRIKFLLKFGNLTITGEKVNTLCHDTGELDIIIKFT